jgi:hypothetical protein
MSDDTDILHAAAISADIAAFLHRGNSRQVAAAIDLLKSLASDIATIAALVPGGQPVAAIAATVDAVAGAAEDAVDGTASPSMPSALPSSAGAPAAVPQH